MQFPLRHNLIITGRRLKLDEMTRNDKTHITFELPLRNVVCGKWFKKMPLRSLSSGKQRSRRVSVWFGSVCFFSFKVSVCLFFASHFLFFTN